jgi:quercetin dioxygenase-like cupin family protein
MTLEIAALGLGGNLFALEKHVLDGKPINGYVATADPSVFPAINHFVPTGGLQIYVRELPIPKGVFMSGHRHKTDHVCMLLKGSLKLHANGSESVIKAGDVFIAKAGTQKAVEAMEDSVFCTLHATNTTDEQELERELIQKSDAFIEYERQRKIA